MKPVSVRSRLFLLPTAALAAAALMGVVAPAHARAATPTCSFLWFDDTPDASNPLSLSGEQLPQLDIVEGDFGLTADHTKLRAVLTILDLSPALPTAASQSDYLMFWNFGSTPAGPTTYATDVNVTNPSGTPVISFLAGRLLEASPPVVGQNTQFVQTNIETGSFGAGPNGQVEVDVPLADIGSPTIGDTLTFTGGFTATGAGALGQGQEFFVDFDPDLGPPETFGNNYTLGQTTCIDSGSVVTPEAPLTVGLLLVGGIAVSTLAVVRRRRAARIRPAG